MSFDASMSSSLVSVPSRKSQSTTIRIVDSQNRLKIIEDFVSPARLSLPNFSELVQLTPFQMDTEKHKRQKVKKLSASTILGHDIENLSGTFDDLTSKSHSKSVTFDLAKTKNEYLQQVTEMKEVMKDQQRGQNPRRSVLKLENTRRYS